MVQVLYVLLCGIAALYVAGPVVIRLTFRHRAYSKYEPVPPEHLPPAVFERFAQAAPDLAREGFEVTTYVKNSGQVAMVSAYLAVWTNHGRGQNATVAAMIPEIGRATFYVEFQTVGVGPLRAVCTLNFRGNAGIYHEMPWRYARYFPSIATTGELYRIHLRRERDVIPPNATRYLPNDEQLVETISSAALFVLHEQARFGLFYETSEPGVFRPTWYGAVIMVMRLLPPVKQLRSWANRRQARGDARRAIAEPVAPVEGVKLTRDSPFEPLLTSDRLTYL
jgi:hypothetical protein